jgi:Tol biopolymer transport system component
MRKVAASIISVFMLTGLSVLQAPSAGAVAAGTDGRVAFVSNRTGTRQIYTSRYDGTGIQQLTSLGSNFDPSFSMDGGRIAFVSTRDGSNEIYTMTADGKTQTRVTNNAIAESKPSWSPTGFGISFAGIVGTDSDIYRIHAKGGGQVDLTPNTPTFFDANASWSPGGILIAFDSTNREGDGKTNIYTMNNVNGSGLLKLTTTGSDSHPSWAPDNKNLTFQSARNAETPGPTLFASIQKPDGILAFSDHLLVTQFNKDHVISVDSAGNQTTFADLPSTGNASLERYIALSPGTNGWPANLIYVTVGANIYQITPDGSSVTLFKNIPSLPNGEASITFDTVGTFGNKMLISDRRGPIWSVTPAGVATQIGDFLRQIEGIQVAPMSWGPYGGQLIGGYEFGNDIYAMNSSGVTTLVESWDTPEGAVFVPPTVCNLTGTTGAYFVSMKDTNQIFMYPASQFAGLSGQALVPSEESTTIGLFTSNGTSISVSQFSAAIGLPELEGSGFVMCGVQGAGAAAAPTAAAAPIIPHDIYKMTSTGAAQTRLTTNANDDSNPAWSPDGGDIVFQTDRNDPNPTACEAAGVCLNEVYTMSSVDGSGQTNITNASTADDGSPDWETVAAISTVSDFKFDPSTLKPKQGQSILFDFVGPDPHTATDNTGMGMFDSGNKPTDSYFAFQFIGAGSYAIICTIHPTQMSGTVKVPISVAPVSGNLTTVFTITWSSAPPPPNYRFDVQIRRPGETVFSDWKTNQKVAATGFTADAGTGTYSFQARLRNTVNGNASGYSAPKSITVS